jgi:hypothetical protein
MLVLQLGLLGQTPAGARYRFPTLATITKDNVPSPKPAAAVTQAFYLRYDDSPNAGPSMPPITEPPAGTATP